MNKKYEILKSALTSALGILYGFISIYWLAFGIVAAGNLFGEDNGNYEEYAFLQPFGFIILLLYLLVLVGIIIKFRTKKKKLAIFLSSGFVTALLFCLLSSIIL